MNIDELRGYNRPALAYLLEFPAKAREDVIKILKADYTLDEKPDATGKEIENNEN